MAPLESKPTHLKALYEICCLLLFLDELSLKAQCAWTGAWRRHQVINYVENGELLRENGKLVWRGLFEFSFCIQNLSRCITFEKLHLEAAILLPRGRTKLKNIV